MRFEMGSPCAWGRGDDRSGTAATAPPSKQKEAKTFPGQRCAKASKPTNSSRTFFSIRGSIGMNPYSGTSTLAKVLRAAAFGGGLVYGSIKLGYLKVRRFYSGNLERRGAGRVVCIRGQGRFCCIVRFLDVSSGAWTAHGDSSWLLGSRYSNSLGFHPHVVSRAWHHRTQNRRPRRQQRKQRSIERL